jgi:hypothetical protein
MAVSESQATDGLEWYSSPDEDNKFAYIRDVAAQIECWGFVNEAKMNETEVHVDCERLPQSHVQDLKKLGFEVVSITRTGCWLRYTGN